MNKEEGKIMSSNMISGKEIANQIKSRKKNIKQVWGGNFPTFAPDVIIKEAVVDALFRGEAEFQFITYLNNLKNYKKPLHQY